MHFAVGDRVVYPHHGAAVISERESLVVAGQARDYLVLHIAHGNLTLKVPIDSVEQVGLRAVIDLEEVDEVMALLGRERGREPSNWSRRFKNNVEKLKSGDVYQVAELVRNLTRRQDERGLSAGEKKMLIDSRRVLVSELTLAASLTPEQAEELVDGVFSQPPVED